MQKIMICLLVITLVFISSCKNEATSDAQSARTDQESTTIKHPDTVVDEVAFDEDNIDEFLEKLDFGDYDISELEEDEYHERAAERGISFADFWGRDVTTSQDIEEAGKIDHFDLVFSDHFELYNDQKTIKLEQKEGNKILSAYMVFQVFKNLGYREVPKELAEKELKSKDIDSFSEYSLLLNLHRHKYITVTLKAKYPSGSRTSWNLGYFEPQTRNVHLEIRAKMEKVVTKYTKKISIKNQKIHMVK